MDIFPSSPKPNWLTAAGSILLFLLIPLATVLLLNSVPPPSEGADRVIERLKAHQTLQSDDAKRLETYAIVDPVKGTFRIPIEHAIDLTIPELNQHPPAPAGLIIVP